MTPGIDSGRVTVRKARIGPGAKAFGRALIVAIDVRQAGGEHDHHHRQRHMHERDHDAEVVNMNCNGVRSGRPAQQRIDEAVVAEHDDP